MAQPFDRLKNCLDYVKIWFSAHKLKLNPDKTKFIIFTSKKQHEKLNKFFQFNIQFGNFLSPAEVVKNFVYGVILFYLS